MIVRQLALRHGPRLFCARSRGVSRRLQSTGIGSIEASLENSLKETHSIEASINQITPARIQPLDFADANADTEVDTTLDDYLSLKHHRATTAHLGTRVGYHYQPYTLLTKSPRPSKITLELLMASQAHMGHSTSLWNPANARYIFGIRQGIHIISLDITASHLRRACKVVSGVAEHGGLILFVGTRPGQDRCVVKAAQLAGGCHLFERWIPGSITNGNQILGRCRTKVVNHLDQEIGGFGEQLQKRAVLKPDLVVCLNPLENYYLLQECGSNNVPTIGVIDTDANPTWVTYPIPANDDSLRCIHVIAGVLGRAGQEGQAKRQKLAEEGRVLYAASHGLKTNNELRSEQREVDEARQQAALEAEKPQRGRR